MSSSEPEFNDAREYSSLEEVMNTLLTAKGKSFRELDQTGRALTGGNKGSLGQIIEESVLKYAINSDAAPDIHIGDTSYELKVTPLKHIKKGKQTSAKERLVRVIGQNVCPFWLVFLCGSGRFSCSSCMGGELEVGQNVCPEWPVRPCGTTVE